MPRVKQTPRKVALTGDGGYAPAPPALFPTVTGTATGPRVAREAREPPVPIPDEWRSETGPAAEGELAPPPGHVLPVLPTRPIIQPVKVRCIDPTCHVTFTRLRNMRRHAAQFHKLHGDGTPATEEEHQAAVLAAADRTYWTKKDVAGYVARRTRIQCSVETEVQRLAEKEQYGDLLSPIDFPDLSDILPRSAWVAALHRAFGCCRVPRSVGEEKQRFTERRPQDVAPTRYLHQLLNDKPALSVQEVVGRAIRLHGWAGGVAGHAS